MKKHPTYHHLWLNEDGEVWSSKIRLKGYAFTDVGEPVRRLRQHVRNFGYLEVSVDGRWIKVHKLMKDVFFPGVEVIDHIDRNRANCKLNNLRPSDWSLNALNREPRKNKVAIGVYYHNNHKRYYGRVMVGGHTINVGSCKEFKDVAALSDRVQALKEDVLNKSGY